MKRIPWFTYTTLIHWVVRGTGTPKDRDGVNRRDVCECEGWVSVLEVIGTPSILSVIRKVATLVRVLPTFTFRVDQNNYESKKRDLKRRLIYEYRCDERLKYCCLFCSSLFSSECLFKFICCRIKKKSEAEGKNCHSKTMWSLEKAI